MPANQVLAEEEQHSRHVVAVVNIAGIVAIVVADQFCSAFSSLVEAHEVDCSSDVA
jgi:hypothetical protein